MAVINNIGLVFTSLGEKHNGDECFLQLLSLLMYLNFGGENSRSDFDTFFRNAAKMNHPDCAVGAGAA